MDRLTIEATEFFDNFVAAFSTFDGALVARLFAHPYLAVDQDGNQRVFENTEATARYFQQHLDNYQSSGSESCRYHSLEVTPIGTQGALVTVTWSLRDPQDCERSTWRESYCVLSNNGKMSAHTSIDHAV